MACSACRKRKLRCDNGLPACSNCLRQGKECEYDRTSKLRLQIRRNRDNVENILVNREAQDGESRACSTSPSVLGAVDVFAQYNSRVDTRDTTPDESDTPGTPFGFNAPFVLLPAQNDGSDLSLMSDPERYSKHIDTEEHERLLSESTKSQLTELFFRDVYPGIPIVHKSRYYASLRFAPSHQPPLCLRYAMWALAALQDQQWSHLANALYERARACLEQDEMRAAGTEVLNVAHVQCWSLIATYESYMLLSLRTWSSIRRAAALAQVLRLHSMDENPESAVQLLPDTQDASELEERRRAFWSAFSGDRWVSSRTGYPMTIADANITTKLPSSEDSFNAGCPEPTQSLDDVLQMGFDPKTSLYGARSVVACVLGRIMQHVGSVTHSGKPSNNQQFWSQHQTLDNLLSKVSQSRSQDLRPSKSTTDPKLWAMDMWLYGLSICLHQTAVDIAVKQGNQVQVSQSHTQCRVAADQIIKSIRSIAHLETRKMDPFTASCVYMAGTVLIRGRTHGHCRTTDIEDLRYLQQVLEMMHKHWKVTEIFITQFKQDLADNGISLMLTPSEDKSSSTKKRAGSFPSVHRRCPSQRALDDVPQSRPV